MPAIRSTENLYFNRELSWLKFNERVLEESVDPTTPLFERLKFLSIFASNLDEFYMVRVGSLFYQVLMGDENLENKTLMTPSEQINAINLEAAKLCPLRDSSYREIMGALSGLAYYHTKFKFLDKTDKQEVFDYFKNQVMPLLSPQIIDVRNPFPNLENKVLYIASHLSSKKGKIFGVIPLPQNIARIYLLPDKNFFLLLEDIILYYAKYVFDSYKILSKTVIRVTRNADIEIDDDFFEENADYVNYFKNIAKKRKKQSPIRFETIKCKENDIADFFLSKLKLQRSQHFKQSSPLDLSFVYDLESRLDEETKKKLVYEPVNPNWPTGLSRNNITEQIMNKDVLLSYPYESMQPFTDLIREASQDINVISIKITLYRIDIKSVIARYLCNAAENGKEVTVEVELQARFDEQNNLYWAKVLEDAGCKIIYGVEEYKVHSKVMLITKKTEQGIIHITHIGTGNYNEKTARLYTDLGILTSNRDIGNDAVKFFQNLAIGNITADYSRLLVSPKSLKSGIIGLIEQEAEKQKAGKPAGIIAKMNSLTDKDVIDSLILASRAGVKIYLIIRGICCLKPGVAGFTDNIEVRSIVGRFLEHSRIFCFGVGDCTKIFIGSADMMTRNTSRRIEVAVPVLDKGIATRIKEMLSIMLQDNVKARILQTDGSYVYFKNNQPEIDSQMKFYLTKD